jgi:hypothetical protein
MNEEAKIPLVIHRLVLFQWVHGGSEFEATAADLATAPQSIARHVGRFGANAVAGAEATCHISLGDTRS